MKRLLMIAMAGVALVGCSSDNTQAKPEEDNEQQTETDDKREGKIENDPYNHYDDVSWNDNFHGIESEITKVVTSNDADGNGNHLVGIKLEVNNTTDETFSYLPAHGTLVLSTGEQVEMAADYNPDEINGEIYEGVEMESNINFLVESDVADIEWVKFIWSVGQTDDDGVYETQEDHEAKLELNE